MISGTVTILLALLTAAYVLKGFGFLWGLFQLNRAKSRREYRVSVVVAARDEERNIGSCLEALLNQTYPREKYEIIIVDDQSTDNTSRIVESYVRSHSNLTLLRAGEPEGTRAQKKYALSLGIGKSCGEIVMTTDADCVVAPAWIEGMVSYFEPEVGLVVGFSQIGSPQEELTLFERVQAIDFLSLMSAAAGTIGGNIPWAASAQNLAYRREVFDQVGGFGKVGHRASGDDVLLLQLVVKETDWKVRFSISEETFVTTRPEKTVGALLNQRRRWASNSTYQLKLNKGFFAFLAATFALNLLLCITVPLSLFVQSLSLAPWLSLLAKATIDFAVISKGARLFRRQDLLLYFPIWEILHVPYIVLAGLLGVTGSFTWKERSYCQQGLL